MSEVKEKIENLIKEISDYSYVISDEKVGGFARSLSDLNENLGEDSETDDDQEAKFLRLYAEFENYKKRSSKEKSDIINTASEKVIVEFLPIVDDLERSLEHMDDNSKKGTEMIINKFKNIMESNNVIRMDPVGKDFNPEYHQALTTVDNPEMIGKVVDVINPGYILGKKVIRFASVVVGK
jgi:molecular chaperone GrpE